MNQRRVVVTGIGTINPIGKNIAEYFESLENGVSGASEITRFDTTEFKTKFACEIKDYKIEDYFERSESKRLDLFVQYALISTDEALIDSKIDLEKENLEKIGVIWGSGIGGIVTFQEECSIFFESKKPRYSPFFIPKMIGDLAPGHISMKYGLKGVNFGVVSACASSNNAIIDAYTYIKLGKADVIISGGSEAAVCEPGIGGFNAMKALSTRNDDPQSASRPFDKNRDGFVLGEGSGTLILEEYEHAIKRGAKIYCEVIGGGFSADAYHMTAPHPEGEGAKRAMKMAMEEAGISANKIDYINVHGTSTPLGDVAELKSIATIFGEDMYNVNISSTKSMTGHLLGAAGAVEALACIKALKDNVIPPTINHSTVDDDIDPKINLTLNKAQKREVNYTLSNTFGFGGHNATLILKKI